MNEDLVLAITMLIILAVVVLFIQISQQIKVKRIQKMKIQRRFGEIPDMEEVLPIEKISIIFRSTWIHFRQVTWALCSFIACFRSSFWEVLWADCGMFRSCRWQA